MNFPPLNVPSFIGVLGAGWRTLLLGGWVVVLMAGCQSAPEEKNYVTTLARFFLETPSDRSVSVTLPQSGVQVAVGSKPVFTEGDIVNVELMQVDLGKCLMFQFTSSAARDLYRVTASNQGKRLVLVINDVAVGARHIERPLLEGALLVFVEVPDVALPALVENLKKTSGTLQRAARK